METCNTIKCLNTGKAVNTLPFSALEMVAGTGFEPMTFGL